MSDDRLVYFVRKAQLVSCENVALRSRIQRDSGVNGSVVTYFFFPFTTLHTAYSVPEIADICQVYRYEQIDEQAILDVGISPERAVDLFCNKLSLTIRRRAQGRPVETKRIRLYTSKLGSPLETVCARLARLKRIRFKLRSGDPSALNWKVVNVYSSKKVSIRGGQLDYRAPQGDAPGRRVPDPWAGPGRGVPLNPAPAPGGPAAQGEPPILPPGADRAAPGNAPPGNPGGPPLDVPIVLNAIRGLGNALGLGGLRGLDGLDPRILRQGLAPNYDYDYGYDPELDVEDEEEFEDAVDEDDGDEQSEDALGANEDVAEDVDESEDADVDKEIVLDDPGDRP